MPDGSENSDRSSYPNLLLGWLLADKRADLITLLEEHFNVYLLDMLAIRDSLSNLKNRNPDITLVQIEYTNFVAPFLPVLPHDSLHPTHLIALNNSSSPHFDRHDLQLGICTVIEDPADDEFIVRTLLHVLADCPAQHAQQKKVPAGDPIDNAFHDGLIDDFDNRILCLLAAGGTNEEIAEALHYSNQTIRNRVSDLLKLLNLRNRTELSSAWSQYLYSKAMRDN